jgi:hypothetical protein
MRNHYEAGKWNAICDRCGFKRKSDMLRKEWTGLMVCADTCWEPKHPQLLLRVPREDGSTPWVRPEPDDIFVGSGDIILTETEIWMFAEDGSFLLTEP